MTRKRTVSFFALPGRGSPAGAPLLSACAERSGKRKSTSKGDTPMCPPWQSPRLKRVRGADVRRCAILLPGAAVVCTLPGRDDVRGVKLFRHSRGYEVPRRIFPRQRAHPLRVSASFIPTGFQRAAALWRLFSIFLFAEKYGRLSAKPPRIGRKKQTKQGR